MIFVRKKFSKNSLRINQDMMLMFMKAKRRFASLMFSLIDVNLNLFSRINLFNYYLIDFLRISGHQICFHFGFVHIFRCCNCESKVQRTFFYESSNMTKKRANLISIEKWRTDFSVDYFQVKNSFLFKFDRFEFDYYLIIYL
jgi:hypothetical protein